MCVASEKAPFFDLCLLGLSSDLRGYQIGQYRDNRMLVGQAEYRRELFWRLGAVAFAGAGAVGSSFTSFGNAEPGGGLGLRFVLAKRNHINLRAAMLGEITATPAMSASARPSKQAGSRAPDIFTKPKFKHPQLDRPDPPKERDEKSYLSQLHPEVQA